VKKEEKMNERIEKLAEQAKKHALDAMIKITDKEQALKVYSESYDTKFAELIVQETISVLQKRFMGDLNREDMEVRRCVEDVKKHFGVEE